MGWTVYYKHNSPKTYADEKREICNLFVPCKEAFDAGLRMDVLQASKVGNVWYLAVKVTGRECAAPYVADDSGAYVIGAVILTSRKDGEWGHKDMEECCGPCEAKAPASIIAKLSPLMDHERATHARDWRARCLAHAARLKPAHGDRIRLAEPVPFTATDGSKVQVQDVTCTFYTRRGKKRTCYHHPAVGLLRLRPDHLTGAVKA